MNARTFKQQLLDELYKPYLKCVMCPLGGLGRTHVVFGSGNPDARLVFVGEGPGQEEDRQNKPFVGRSGQLLNKIFAAIGIDREEVFITNIVKCRPPNNRKPTASESAICKEILLEKQLKIIRPDVICTLGSAALEGLLTNPVKISAHRGKQTSYQGMILLPTYHPAYILRNPKELEILYKDIEKAHQLTKASEKTTK